MMTLICAEHIWRTDSQSCAPHLCVSMFHPPAFPGAVCGQIRKCIESLDNHIRYIFCFHFLLKPPIGRGHRGVILSDGPRVVMLTQHAQRPGGAQLPFPAAAARQSERGLQPGENTRRSLMDCGISCVCVCVGGGIFWGFAHILNKLPPS